MAERALRLTVLTPEGTAFDEELRSLRVPADTGQVGLRPRMEPAALTVEPGLVLALEPGRTRYLATAGGLLRCDGERAVLLTPLAVAGDEPGSVERRLAAALGGPSADLELRGRLGRLEAALLDELRRDRPATREAGP